MQCFLRDVGVMKGSKRIMLQSTLVLCFVNLQISALSKMCMQELSFVY